MIQKLSKLSALLTTLFLFTACTPSKPMESTVKTDAKENSGFLWQAQKGKQTLNVLGTVHVGVPAKELDPQVWKLIESSDALVVEVDLQKVNQQEIIPLMIFPPTTSLSKEIGIENFAKLQKMLPMIPSAQLDRLRPSAVLPTLTQIAIKNPSEPMDQSIMKYAVSKKIPVVQLETAMQQIKMLNNLYGVDALREYLESGETEKLKSELSEGFAKIIKVYRNGNPDELMGLMTGEDQPMVKLGKEEMRVLFDERNANWAEAVKDYDKNKTYFFAVGAGHLFGDEGFLTLLEKQGYSLKAL